MRFASIIVFLFCIHVSVAMINATVGPDGVWPILQTQNQAQTEWFTSVGGEIDDGTYLQNTVQSNAQSVELGYGDLVRGMGHFFIVFGKGVIWVPSTIQSFGVPSPLYYFLSLPVYMIYMLAIVQIIMNRTFRGMS